MRNLLLVVLATGGPPTVARKNFCWRLVAGAVGRKKFCRWLGAGAVGRKKFARRPVAEAVDQKNSSGAWWRWLEKIFRWLYGGSEKIFKGPGG
jgi:hypothetical protein